MHGHRNVKLSICLLMFARVHKYLPRSWGFVENAWLWRTSIEIRRFEGILTVMKFWPLSSTGNCLCIWTAHNFKSRIISLELFGQTLNIVCYACSYVRNLVGRLETFGVPGASYLLCKLSRENFLLIHFRLVILYIYIYITGRRQAGWVVLSSQNKPEKHF